MAGALSAAGRTLAGLQSLQKEINSLKEGEQHVQGLREKIRGLEKELSEVLRPKMRQCNQDAGTSRMRCNVLQKSIDELGEARAKAAQEVGGLSKRQLSEIRQLLRSPPEPVKRTLAACWLLLNCERFKDKSVSFDEKTDWPRCQRMLVDETFMSSILSFDSKRLDEVPSVPACVASTLGWSQGAPKAKPLRRSATVPPLDLPSVQRASEPCGPLLRWLQELVAEHRERMRLRLELVEAELLKAKAESSEAAAEADVAEAEALLNRLQEALKSQEKTLLRLQEEKATAEKALEDIGRLDSLEAPSRASKLLPRTKEAAEVDVELEVSGTLAAVEQQLARCVVKFRPSEAEVLEGDAQQALVLPRIAAILKDHRGKLKLLLEGHQSESEEAGIDIERSLAVYQWLVEVAGCAPGLLRLKGCGPTAGMGHIVVPVPIQELVVRSGPKPENFPGGLYFVKDTTELLEETKMLLQPLGAFCKDYSLRLEGHIDKDENPNLAGQRAVRIRELLIEQGVPRSQLKPQNCKALHPLSRTQLAMNRRVELHII